MKAIAESPSKAIITGEHFVVHGAWALAAALPRKVRVEVEEADSFGVSSDRFGPHSPELRPVASVVKRVSRELSVSGSVRVKISSSIPEGSGLGSSAATMVALVSALSRLNSLQLSADEVVKFSMTGESELHGRPSGIDPTVCAYGGALLFRPGSRPRPLRLRGRRSLILCNSGITRSTKGEIGKVSTMKERYPGTFSALADALGELSIEAAGRLSSGDMRGLGRLLTVNHSALAFMGVSNGTLDGIVDRLVSLGAYGAKLTGAGGGGSVLAVAPEAKEKSILSGLSRGGFETFRAEIPAPGVRSWSEQ